jgi:hypothetical protein
MAPPATLSRASLVLVVITVGGLFASLLASGEGPRWGTGLGAAGASIYAVGVAVLVLQVARAPERIFPAQWSVCERRAWAAVFFGTLILLSFAHFLWSEAQHDQPPMTLHMFMFRRFGWNLGVLLGAATMVHRLLGARLADDVESDERDLRIRHAADRAGNRVLTMIVITAVILLATLPAQMLEWWLAPLIAAHALIGVLICKSLAENVWLVARYARERR